MSTIERRAFLAVLPVAGIGLDAHGLLKRIPLIYDEVR
jgi:hypothetical protein